MNLETKRRTPSLKTVIIVGLLLVIAVLLGWIFGNSRKSNTTQSTTTPTINSNSASEPSANSDLKKLVSYSLPDGWKEGVCDNAPNKIFIVPNGTLLDCNANPSSPIKIYVDPAGATDCQQLGNVQNVRKHICKSQYIHGHKSLVTLTEYPQPSSELGGTSIARYYIDTGRGVVRVEYVYSGDSKYQMGFDELANSVKVKN